jgi:uncharacterized protein
MTFEHNGDLYSCDHFVEPRYRLGNIREKKLIELVAAPQQREFGLAKRDSLPRFCRSAACASPATADARRTGSPARPTASPACTIYAPATRRSSATSARRCRPCASCCVLASHPRRSPCAMRKRTPGRRNEACTCRSGRKWKHCHGSSHSQPISSQPGRSLAPVSWGLGEDPVGWVSCHQGDGGCAGTRCNGVLTASRNVWTRR